MDWTLDEFRETMEVIAKARDQGKPWVYYMGTQLHRKFDANIKLECMKDFKEITQEEYNSIMTMISSPDEGDLTMAEELMSAIGNTHRHEKGNIQLQENEIPPEK